MQKGIIQQLILGSVKGVCAGNIRLIAPTDFFYRLTFIQVDNGEGCRSAQRFLFTKDMSSTCKSHVRIFNFWLFLKWYR